MPRAYSSTLRAEQVEQTRQRLLAKLADMLADETVTEISVADVAKRAGVSVRTAYRYFQTREELLAAFNAEGSDAIHGKPPPRPTDASGLVGFARGLVQWYVKNETIFRAVRWSKTAVELREQRKKDQIRFMLRVMRPITAHLEPNVARTRAAVLNTLQSSNTMLDLRDTWQLSPSDVEDAVAWATTTLLAQLEKDSKSK